MIDLGIQCLRLEAVIRGLNTSLIKHTLPCSHRALTCTCTSDLVEKPNSPYAWPVVDTVSSTMVYEECTDHSFVPSTWRQSCRS